MTSHLIVICKAPSMLNEAKHRDSAQYLGMANVHLYFKNIFYVTESLKLWNCSCTPLRRFLFKTENTQKVIWTVHILVLQIKFSLSWIRISGDTSERTPRISPNTKGWGSCLLSSCQFCRTEELANEAWKDVSKETHTCEKCSNIRCARKLQ